MAVTASGAGLSAGILRCLVRQNPDEGHVRNKAVHIALGVRGDGTKEILGLWIETNEGAKFWLRVMNELKNRGVEDILIAVVDGLKGFPEAINAVFPETTVQTCIVHLLRNSLDFASWKDRKDLARELKSIYGAIDDRAAEAALMTFEGGFWGRKFPAVAQIWRRAWQEVIPFLAFPKDVRRIIYNTTNAIEALNSKLRGVCRAGNAGRTRGLRRDRPIVPLPCQCVSTLAAKTAMIIQNETMIAVPGRFESYEAAHAACLRVVRAKYIDAYTKA
jgi:transposase-like protein